MHACMYAWVEACRDTQEHHILFDDHYELAKTTVQALKTQGDCTLAVLEALRCPPPNTNNGEDNAVFKSLIGTLIRCPGPGRCADPLMCSPGLFQVTVPESTPLSSTGQTLRLSRTTCPDTSPSTYSCRLQWKAGHSTVNLPVWADRAV